VVLVGTEGGGVWRSTDGGSSYLPSSSGIAAARVTALAKSRGWVIASVAHGGPISGIYGVLAAGERVVHELSSIPTVLGLTVAGDEAWAATEGGLFARREGVWSRVAELPAARVEQVVAADGRVVARTLDGLFERQAGRFVRVSLPAPSRSGALDPRWQQHLRGRARVLATGNGAFPAVVIDEEGARLFATGDRALHLLKLPVPARDVLAATVDGGRLLLGTSGYGLLYAGLDELVPASGLPGTVAGGSQR
jgi:hypothetical protein